VFRLRTLLRSLGARTASGLVVLWVTATLAFLALKAMPGDPALAVLAAGGNPTPEAVAAFRHEHGLDRPLAVQYGIYLAHLVRGDLGVSYSQHQPVSQVLLEQTGDTLLLTVSSLALAWLLVLTWTVLTSAEHPWLRGLGAGVETICAALPHFWLGIVLLTLFSFQLRLFPPAGNEGWQSLVLPSLTLAVPLAGFIGQVTRESLQQVMEEPFILSARTRGSGEWAIRARHALRHALLPAVSLSGWAIGALVSGAVVVESIFSRRGLGRELVSAVQLQDLPLTLGITLVVAVVYVLANLLADLAYHLIDPRIRPDSP
jgi:peptide/nickel transport system permease protein